jgi:hypothetical protein
MTFQSSPDSSCSLMQILSPRPAKGHGFFVSIRVVKYPRLNGPHAIQFSKSDRGPRSLLRTPPDDLSKSNYLCTCSACFRPIRDRSNMGRNPSASHPAAGAGTYATRACRSRGFLSPLEGFLQTRGVSDSCARSSSNLDLGKTSLSDLDQFFAGFEDASRVRNTLLVY